MDINEALKKLETISTITKEVITGLTSPGPVEPPPPVGVRVTTAEEFRLALAVGGNIVLAPGTFGGNFVTQKPTIITEEKPGTVTLACEDRFEPTLQVQSSDVSVPAFTIRNGAIDRECVVVGSGTQTNPKLQPQRVVFNGTKIHAGATGGRRGLALHGSFIAVRSVDIRGFWYQGQDAQGIWINNGEGPYEVLNSYIEGSHENILIGGDRLPMGKNPANILIKGCTLYKPQAWRAYRGSVKTSFEAKCGEGVVFEDNVIDGCWIDGQAGNAITLTPRNQYGDAPFTRLEDVVLRNNVVRNCKDGFAVNILGADDGTTSQRTNRVTIEGNLFEDTAGGLQVGNALGLTLLVYRNTFPGIKRHFLTFSTQPLARLEFIKNVARSGEYGVHSPNAALGLATVMAATETYSFKENVIEQSAARTIKYPIGNRVLAPGDLAALLGANYRLADGSAGW